MKSGIYRPLNQDAVAFGKPWSEVLPSELQRLGARRVFVLSSATFARESRLAERLDDALGPCVAGLFTGIRAHTPREDVIAAATQAREAGADFLLAFGGGSVIDAAKIVQLCLATDVRDAGQLGELAYTKQPRLPAGLPIRMAAVPTTLSGAEFTFFGGATDLHRRVKEGYVHPAMLPRIVVLDPDAGQHTPDELWLSTGMRAIDHAVEALCSPGAHPLADAAALEALQLLSQGLPAIRADGDLRAARTAGLCGVWLATTGLQSSVPMGASHGIGHALGATAGVPHGVTSCLMLPHVLRWNQPVCADRQARISAALGEPGADAGDAVARLVRRLGLPSRIRDTGTDRALLPTIAKHALHDPWTAANPRPLKDEAAILDLLEAAW